MTSKNIDFDPFLTIAKDNLEREIIPPCLSALQKAKKSADKDKILANLLQDHLGEVLDAEALFWMSDSFHEEILFLTKAEKILQVLLELEFLTDADTFAEKVCEVQERVSFTR